MRDVFLTFLRLGLTSFGGPIAHLGYFRREFVERRRWLDEAFFTQIVAFCTILPGPTSSQVGFVIGLVRAGPAGALGAWLGFTLPSALALAAAAAFLTTIESRTPAAAPAWLAGLLAGLGAAATAIVAQAVLGMAKSQCPDAATRTIAAAAAAIAVALAPFSSLTWVPIAAGALAGVLMPAAGPAAPQNSAMTPMLERLLPRAASFVAGGLFIALIGAAALVAGRSATGTFVATIVRAGSLVFGGGHVVLPLLQSLVPAGLVAAKHFSAGYGITQAMPGPLFTFAAFLGEANRSALHGPLGAAAATALIFLPSFLLVIAALPVLGALRSNRAAAAALRGANAAVVGLLGALLYSPLLLALGTSAARVAIALMVFTLVTTWNVAPWVAVLGAAGAGSALAAAGVLR